MAGTKNIFSVNGTHLLNALLCLIIANTSIPAAAQPDSASDITNESVQALRRELLKGEVEEKEIVMIGPDKSTLALWRKQTSGTPYGAILLLHDDGQHPDWPFTLRPVRTNLTQFGWSTLSISLPDTVSNEIPPRPDPTPTPAQTNEEKEETDSSAVDAEETAKLMEQDSEVDKQAESATPVSQTPTNVKQEPKVKKDFEKLAQQHIEWGMRYLNEQGQFNIIVVAYGTAAYRAAKFINQEEGSGVNLKVKGKKQRAVRALALVSARNTIATEEQEIVDFFNDPSMPIYDIYFDNHHLDEIESKKRKVFTKQQNFKHYYQFRMAEPKTAIFEGENQLTRRIRGFLNKHARGVEVGK